MMGLWRRICGKGGLLPRSRSRIETPIYLSDAAMCIKIAFHGDVLCPLSLSFSLASSVVPAIKYFAILI